MVYFTKTDDGEFKEVADSDVFKERHERWIRSESAAIRKEVEEKIRAELAPELKKAAQEEARAEFQPKIDEAAARAERLDVQLRQKTIAAEYGFKAGTEKYLGNGTEDEMRAEADNLKRAFSAVAPIAPEKITSTDDASADSFVKLSK